jgi:hypothetical protein
MNNLPNSTAQVLTENLLVPQLFKRFFALKEPEVSLPCSQQPTTGSYTGPTAVFLRYLLILSSHVLPSLPGFSAKKPVCIYLLSIRATCLAHDILLNMITLFWRVQIMNLLIMPPPVASSLYRSITFISTLFSNTPGICSSFQVQYPSKTTSKL